MANGVDPDPADLERIETFLRAIVEMEKANANCFAGQDRQSHSSIILARIQAEASDWMKALVIFAVWGRG
jgi:hypothetical protein